MSLASRLRTLGLAAVISAGPFAAAQAEIPTTDFEESPPIHAGVKPLMAPTDHRRPYAGVTRRDARRDAVIRNEEDFDRAFGMCRRC
jgi:hypothetical protein